MPKAQVGAHRKKPPAPVQEAGDKGKSPLKGLTFAEGEKALKPPGGAMAGGHRLPKAPAAPAGKAGEAATTPATKQANKGPQVPAGGMPKLPTAPKDMPPLPAPPAAKAADKGPQVPAGGMPQLPTAPPAKAGEAATAPKDMPPLPATPAAKAADKGPQVPAGGMPQLPAAPASKAKAPATEAPAAQPEPEAAPELPAYGRYMPPPLMGQAPELPAYGRYMPPPLMGQAPELPAYGRYMPPPLVGQPAPAKSKEELSQQLHRALALANGASERLMPFLRKWTDRRTLIKDQARAAAARGETGGLAAELSHLESRLEGAREITSACSKLVVPLYQVRQSENYDEQALADAEREARALDERSRICEMTASADEVVLPAYGVVQPPPMLTPENEQAERVAGEIATGTRTIQAMISGWVGEKEALKLKIRMVGSHSPKQASELGRQFEKLALMIASGTETAHFAQHYEALYQDWRANPQRPPASVFLDTFKSAASAMRTFIVSPYHYAVTNELQNPALLEQLELPAAPELSDDPKAPRPDRKHEEHAPSAAAVAEDRTGEYSPYQRKTAAELAPMLAEVHRENLAKASEIEASIFKGTRLVGWSMGELRNFDAKWAGLWVGDGVNQDRLPEVAKLSKEYGPFRAEADRIEEKWGTTQGGRHEAAELRMQLERWQSVGAREHSYQIWIASAPQLVAEYAAKEAAIGKRMIEQNQRLRREVGAMLKLKMQLDRRHNMAQHYERSTLYMKIAPKLPNQAQHRVDTDRLANNERVRAAGMTPVDDMRRMSSGSQGE